MLSELPDTCVPRKQWFRFMNKLAAETVACCPRRYSCGQEPSFRRELKRTGRIYGVAKYRTKQAVCTHGMFLRVVNIDSVALDWTKGDTFINHF